MRHVKQMKTTRVYESGSKEPKNKFSLYLDPIFKVWVISNEVENTRLRQCFLSIVVFLCLTPIFQRYISSD